MPKSRGKRKRIAQGVYSDEFGFEAVVSIGGGERRRTKSKRFQRGTSLKTIREWQDVTRAALHTKHPVRVTGTFSADAVRYLGQQEHLAGYVSRRSELRAWTALHGDMARALLTADHVREARVLWLKNGVAPKTINNRVQTLRHVFHTLDGKRAETPCDEVTDLPVPKTIPMVVSAETILKVDQELQLRERVGLIRSAKSRARFRVLVTTGKRPSELMRAEPGDVDITRRVWIVRDGKGGFSPGVYLNDDMLAAWRLFIDTKAWGHFREGSWVVTLRRAGWPKNVRPYMARHSVGMLMSDAGVDLSDIQAHLGHKRIETTRNTYVPVLGSRLQKASELLAGRLPWRDLGDELDDIQGRATPPKAAESSRDDALQSTPPLRIASSRRGA
jgi:integrase